MKRNKLYAVAAGLLFALPSLAQISQDFNAPDAGSLSALRNDLQSHCWFLPGFDINNNGWQPGIEGNGAMVSGKGCSPSQQSGIATPLLDISQPLQIQFKYKSEKNAEAGIRRWIKIYLTDNNLSGKILLDSLDISLMNTAVYSYNRSFSASSGCYRLFINYQGTGGSNALAIDALQLSASYRYAGGCSEAPVAVDDRIGGAANHQASGNVLMNDSLQGPSSQVRCYLINESPDGTVQLNPDGSFHFTPNADFGGSSTHFTYKVCDNSPCSALCSRDATATINFPAGAFVPISVIDFNGLYRNGGYVVINWITTYEQNSRLFEIQRSVDGVEWETVGKVEAQGVSKSNHLYAFTDNVGKNKAVKRDLYYRLVQVSLDGRTSMSKILIVRVYNTRTVKMICVTPNPVKDDIVATLQLNEKSMVALRVVTASGTVMLRKTVELDPGSSRVQMDGSSRLRPGPYFLEMIVNSRERMIVQLIKD